MNFLFGIVAKLLLHDILQPKFVQIEIDCVCSLLYLCSISDVQVHHVRILQYVINDIHDMYALKRLRTLSLSFG